MYNDLTVMENLNFFADVFSVRGEIRRERIQRLLEFARLTEFTNRRAGHSVGRDEEEAGPGLRPDPRTGYPYLDEPTTGVDPVSRREFWDILTDLHIQGVTILVSTPYMDEAERCSRVGLMYEGRLIECDTPAAIKDLLPGQLLELKPVTDSGHSIGVLQQAKALVRTPARRPGSADLW